MNLQSIWHYPISRIDPKSSTRAGASARGPTARPKPALRSLLLEDDEMNAYLLQEYLKRIGLPPARWEMSIADVVEMTDEIVRGAFDIIFLDLMLPDGESYALARHLSERCAIPLIAYTARTGPIDRSRLSSSGFHDCLTKPLSFSQFKTQFQGYIQ